MKLRRPPGASFDRAAFVWNKKEPMRDLCSLRRPASGLRLRVTRVRLMETARRNIGPLIHAPQVIPAAVKGFRILETGVLP